jgi:hypothetical protein
MPSTTARLKARSETIVIDEMVARPEEDAI